MLEDRKAAILRAVVEQYIESAQPVGSGHVVDMPGVEVSSATVRNEMVALEEQGFLRQPHTSAGRVPTEKGYRFFVDHLAAPATLDRTRRDQVRSFFDHAHRELERMLADTSQLLSRLTDYAAVVVGPEVGQVRVRSVSLVRLNDHHGLLVVVLSNGVIEKRVLGLDDEVDDGHLAEAGARLDQALNDRTLADAVALDVTPSGRTQVDTVIADALAELTSDASRSDTPVYVDGASRVASAFDAIDTVHEVLAILEQQLVVVSLVRDVLGRGLSVAIGTETGVDPLSECALVVAPYEVEGEPVGTIGVLGPARMNYPDALAAVAVVSNRLGRYLSDA